MQMDRTDEISDGGKMGLGMLREPDDQSCLQSENSLVILTENYMSPSKELRMLES